MASGDQYRVMAADMYARAKDHTDRSMRAQFDSLALSYLRLAEQADRKVAYEQSSQTHPAHPTQQQQQPQSQPQARPDKSK
jgi:hypothetical protein